MSARSPGRPHHRRGRAHGSSRHHSSQCQPIRSLEERGDRAATLLHGPAPNVAVIFLQPQCNMHCTFCVTENNFDAMTFEQASELLRVLQCAGVRNVVIGGGEPFDWPHDVVAIAQHAKAMGFTVQVGTNGVALPGGFERLDCFDRFVIPLESVDPRPHNRMRLYRDRHHGIILDRLAALRRGRKSVTLSTVITSVNHDEVLAVGRFLRDYHKEGGRVHAWHLYQFLPIGRGGAVNGDRLLVAPETYLRICREIDALGLPFRVYRRSDMYRSQTVDFFWYESGLIRRGAEAWPVCESA